MSLIDYGLGQTNIDHTTGIRYGCISMHSLASWIYDEAEPVYPDRIEVRCDCGHIFMATADTDLCPECKCNTPGIVNDFQNIEPIGWHYLPNDPDYDVEYSESLNCLIITKSPYFTLCNLCSPCVPGAGDLDSYNLHGLPTYCFPEDFFEPGTIPYKPHEIKIHYALPTE